jgi:hypothetical protein
MDKLKELEDILIKKINYLTKHPDDCNEKKLPGLVEALKDLHEIDKR